MITMKGQFNSANIMIDDIDETTKEQIQKFLNHPAFGNTYISIMPDCHAGNGVVVGFTMKMNDYIIPNVIGVDIGCGMLSYNFGKINLDLKSFDRFIKEKIPSGFNVNKDIPQLGIAEFNSEFAMNILDICQTINLDDQRVFKSLGSLGGGNHFIEAGVDSLGNLWVTIHSGSRNFGKCIADFYQKKAKSILSKFFIGEGEYKQLEFMHVASEDAQDYIQAMHIAQKFASLNRDMMMQKIEKFIDHEIPGAKSSGFISSVHNYINFEDKIIRKGATAAHDGQMLVIPFNMRDGIAICMGKGSEKYNLSAPHGAGRIMSRTQAKKELSLGVFKDQMKDVYTTTANIHTLDEAPGAYKDKDLILKNIDETVKVIDFIKPIYNFKAAEK
jgi:tRNA-splicing ligase RtcB